MTQTIRSLIFSLGTALTASFIILISLNLYGYHRVKGNMADAIIAETSTTELKELRTFLDETANMLNIARDWGRNGVFERDNIVALNKKLFPFMQNRNHPAGLLLADSTGWEYFLYKADQGMITRISRVEPESTLQVWQQWTTPEQKVKQWQERSEYDPRSRPWFSSPGNGVTWTSPYLFYESGKPGITTSISWVIPEEPDKYMVFGMDLLLEDIRGLLDQQPFNRDGVLFLVNPEAGYSISRSLARAGESDDEARRQIIDLATEAWQKQGHTEAEAVSFQYNRQRWLARFRQLGSTPMPIWLGVAGSEKEMAAPLKKILFTFDLTDLLVALGGGFGLLLLMRRFRRRADKAITDPVEPESLTDLIRAGEGARLEFKSSVRYNLNTKKTGKEIELAWLKAVVAFLNSNGGTVLLGVADDGTVLGLTADNFENNDRCLLHVKNLLNQHIGAVFFPLIDISLETHGEHRVVMITCRPSSEPVFLRVGKNEEFFIRSGPSNTRLSPSQIIDYMDRRGGKKQA